MRAVGATFEGGFVSGVSGANCFSGEVRWERAACVRALLLLDLEGGLPELVYLHCCSEVVIPVGGVLSGLVGVGELRNVVGFNCDGRGAAVGAETALSPSVHRCGSGVFGDSLRRNTSVRVTP